MSARVIVSTFQRGGSSLVMQMLAAAGLPCLGDWPAFEDDRAGMPAGFHAPFDASWIADAEGQALKLLEPHRWACGYGLIPARRGIWLDRDPKDRAKSTLKFMRAMNAEQAYPRQAIGALAKGYRQDRRAALDSLAALCVFPPLILRFDQIICQPEKAARDIARYLGIDRQHERAMAAQVQDRTPGVYRGLLEAEMLAARDAAMRELSA